MTRIRKNMSLARPLRGPRGFTLTEVVVTLPIVALLMVGAFDLFQMSLRLGSKTGAQLAATQDAANAIQQVVEIGREANALSLLDAGTLPAAAQNAGYTSGQFSTTLNGQTLYTGVLVTLPAALQPSDVTGYSGSGLTYITLKNNAGGSLPATQLGPMPNAPYTASPTGGEAATQSSFLLFRADSNGTPDPAAGGYLWKQPLPVSSGSPGYAVCRTIATGTPNAVQFVQPQSTNEFEVKIVCGLYSAINGVQTDEEGNGTFSSQLNGKCVLMRDHNPAGTSSGTTSTYNPFAAH